MLITSGVNLDQVDKEDFQKWAGIFAKGVVQAVNGNLDFFSNFKCQKVNVSFLSTNADVAVPHTLGFIPNGYITIKQTASVGVKTGLGTWTQNVIYLSAGTVGSVTLLLI